MGQSTCREADIAGGMTNRVKRFEVFSLGLETPSQSNTYNLAVFLAFSVRL